MGRPAGRVLVLLEHARIGGGTLVAADLLEEWVAGEVDARTVVLGLADEPMVDLLRVRGGVEVLELEGPVRRIRALRRRLVDRSPRDVVLAVGDYCGILAAATVATLPGRRRPAVVIAEHQPRPLRDAVRDARGPVAARAAGVLEVMLRRRTAGSVLTAVMPEPLKDARVRAARPAVVIPNPSRTPEVGPGPVVSRLERIRAHGPVRLIAVGAVNAQKDHGTLLRALGVLDRRFTLTVVGNGDVEGLRRAAEEQVLTGRVEALGPRDDVIAQLDAHDVFVLSSRWETAYPLVVIEAIVRGLPVVATECSPAMRGFAAELPSVRLTRVGDPEGLAAAISSVADDPPSRDALLAASAALRARHDPARAAADHLRLFATSAPGFAP